MILSRHSAFKSRLLVSAGEGHSQGLKIAPRLYGGTPRVSAGTDGLGWTPRRRIFC